MRIAPLICAALFCGLALAVSATAHAQTAPKGWTVEASPGAWIATSPDHVRLAFYPVDAGKSTLIYWFEDAGLRHTYPFGVRIRSQEPSKRTADPNAGALMAQSRTVEDAAGARTAVYSYAWQTPKGKQLALIVLPYVVAQGQDSPAFTAAFAELTAAWKSGFAYTPAIKAGP